MNVKGMNYCQNQMLVVFIGILVVGKDMFKLSRIKSPIFYAQYTGIVTIYRWYFGCVYWLLAFLPPSIPPNKTQNDDNTNEKSIMSVYTVEPEREREREKHRMAEGYDLLTTSSFSRWNSTHWCLLLMRAFEQQKINSSIFQ